MADIFSIDPVVLQRIIDATKETGKLAEMAKLCGVSFDQFKGFISTATTKIGEVGKTAMSAGKSIAEMAKETKNAAEGTNNYSKFLDIFKEKMSAVTNATEEDILSTTKLASTLAFYTTNILSANNALELFKADQLSSDRAAKALSDTIGEYATKTLPKLGEHLKVAINNFTEAMINTNKFENALFSAAMAGGNFYNSINDDVGNLSSNLTAFSTDVADKAKASALILGVSYSDALSRITQTLSTLPGEFGKTYDKIQVGTSLENKTFTGMELLSQTARGTGKDFSEALKIARNATELFGMTAKDGAERLAMLNQTASKLKIPFSELQTDVQGVEGQFKFWGSQMEGTINILSRMSDALKNSGVGFKGQLELVKELAGSIERMSIQMRSFIGISSGLGGAGGAIGAGLEIEGMLQEGRIDEVAGMMQEALEQKSGMGRVLTLGEARGSPEMTGEFMKQRMLLQTMSGISDPGKLNRLMEAMAGGAIGGAERGMDKGEALKNALDAGRSLQQSQTNYAALQLSVSKDQAALLNSINQAITGRELTSANKGEYDDLFRNRGAIQKVAPHEIGKKQISDMTARSTLDVLVTGADVTERLGKNFDASELGQAIKERILGNAYKQKMDKIKELESKKTLSEDEKKQLASLQKESEETFSFQDVISKSVGAGSGGLTDKIRAVAKNKYVSDFGPGAVEAATSPFASPTGKGSPFAVSAEAKAAPVGFEPLNVTITLLGAGGEELGQLKEVIHALVGKMQKVMAGQ